MNPREAQLDFIITRSAIAVIVIIVLVFLSSFAYRDGVKYGLINAFPVSTTGVITSVKDESGFKWNAQIDYKFIDQISKKEISAVYLQNKNFDKYNYIEGEMIEVLSSKYFPKQNFIKHRLYQLESGFNILAGSSLVILFILIFLAWNTKKYVKFKNEEKRY